MLAGFRVVPYYALTRFGKWDEMLNEPAPPEGNPFLEGMWHYARGVAYAATGQLEEAEGELEEVRRIGADPALDAPMFSPNKMAAVFAIAPEALAGEIALAKQDYHEAVDRYERAVRLNDGLAYTEPAEWHYPPRQALAAVLMKASWPAEAETVYWEDLKRNPENGWALRGLMDSLMAQGKQDQARLVEKRFKAAWSSADEVALMASRRP
jgi:tetratricopeptide (TPR) repeat protein